MNACFPQYTCTRLHPPTHPPTHSPIYRTVPHLLHNVTSLPFKDTICRDPAETYGEGACGLWVMLFIFSKVPELVDTVFIVFRKSKLQVNFPPTLPPTHPRMDA